MPLYTYTCQECGEVAKFLLQSKYRDDPRGKKCSCGSSCFARNVDTPNTLSEAEGPEDIKRIREEMLKNKKDTIKKLRKEMEQ